MMRGGRRERGGGRRWRMRPDETDTVPLRDRGTAAFRRQCTQGDGEGAKNDRMDLVR